MKCSTCGEEANFVCLDKNYKPLGASCSLKHLAETLAETKELDGRTVMTRAEYDALPKVP